MRKIVYIWDIFSFRSNFKYLFVINMPFQICYCQEVIKELVTGRHLHICDREVFTKECAIAMALGEICKEGWEDSCDLSSFSSSVVSSLLSCSSVSLHRKE